MFSLTIERSCPPLHVRAYWFLIFRCVEVLPLYMPKYPSDRTVLTRQSILQKEKERNISKKKTFYRSLVIDLSQWASQGSGNSDCSKKHGRWGGKRSSTFPPFKRHLDHLPGEEWERWMVVMVHQVRNVPNSTHSSWGPACVIVGLAKIVLDYM